MWLNIHMNTDIKPVRYRKDGVNLDLRYLPLGKRMKGSQLISDSVFAKLAETKMPHIREVMVKRRALMQMLETLLDREFEIRTIPIEQAIAEIASYNAEGKPVNRHLGE